jgi:uncharacterized membrane protein YraQ (UPF0718 family)
MIYSFASWIVFTLLKFEPKSRVGDSLHFFVYDSIKILLLLLIMTSLMGIINSYFPVEKVKNFLIKRKWYGFDHLLASLFGAVTPFCSCSSIPLFMGFLKGGIPLGVTLSFLITSPLVNEVAFAVFMGIFGIKVTLIYAISGILLGTIVGYILGKMNLERYLEDWVKESLITKSKNNNNTEEIKLSFNERLPEILKEALKITIGIIPYLFLGIGIGALIHGFLPTGYFEAYITKDNPLAVPIAVILGVPMYANATSVIPIIQALVEKGIPLGTALAFSMAVVGLSLPEATLLKKVMKTKLVFIYFGSVSLAIIFLGYFYNFIF